MRCDWLIKLKSLEDISNGTACDKRCLWKWPTSVGMTWNDVSNFLCIWSGLVGIDFRVKPSQAATYIHLTRKHPEFLSYPTRLSLAVASGAFVGTLKGKKVQWGVTGWLSWRAWKTFLMAQRATKGACGSDQHLSEWLETMSPTSYAFGQDWLG